jgi:putative tryptophan/tyrosine transport system substrate-binding protein
VSKNTVSSPGPLVEAFRQGLRELGYTEQRNIVLEYRYAEGNEGRIATLVNDLVHKSVDLLVVPSGIGAQAAKKATKTIPIVIIVQVDPVATGLVASLARPGGNITGLARLQRHLSGKRLEMLKKRSLGSRAWEYFARAKVKYLGSAGKNTKRRQNR